MSSEPQSSTTKIYSDDELLKYKDTEISASRRKSMIDGVLAEYGVQDVLWHWNKEAIDKKESAEIYVMFKVAEIINDVLVRVPIHVPCPIIWDKEKPKGRPPRPEQVNWNVSVGTMYHFIYTHLNSAYAMRSSKVVAFLPYIRSATGQLLKDMILPKLSEYEALEYHEIETEEKPPERKNVSEGEIVRDV
jgi:hypothetical protein